MKTPQDNKRADKTPISIGEVFEFIGKYKMVCPPTVESRDKLIKEIENGEWDEPVSSS